MSQFDVEGLVVRAPSLKRGRYNNVFVGCLAFRQELFVCGSGQCRVREEQTRVFQSARPDGSERWCVPGGRNEIETKEAAVGTEATARRRAVYDKT